MQPHKLISPEGGIYSDELDSVLRVRLKHILPNTFFTISLADSSSFVLRSDRSVIDVRTYREWTSLEAFCAETGYTLEATIDAWRGEVINPDMEVQQQDAN